MVSIHEGNELKDRFFNCRNCGRAVHVNGHQNAQRYCLPLTGCRSEVLEEIRKKKRMVTPKRRITPKTNKKEQKSTGLNCSNPTCNKPLVGQHTKWCSEKCRRFITGGTHNKDGTVIKVDTSPYVAVLSELLLTKEVVAKGFKTVFADIDELKGQLEQREAERRDHWYSRVIKKAQGR